MKVYSYISTAFMALAMTAATLTSCSSDDWTVADKPATAEVYFSNASSAEYLLEENQNTVEVEVLRLNKSAELTVPVSATDESGLFTVAQSVTFAAGDSVARIPVTFQFDQLTPNTDYTLTLKVEGETSVYGDAETTVTIKYSPWSEWQPYGWEYPETSDKHEITFSEWETIYAGAKDAEGNVDYDAVAKDGEDGLPVFTYAQFFSGTGTQPLFYRQSQIDPNKAQLLLYDWGIGTSLTIDWDKTTDTFTCAQTYCYSHNTYGSVYVADSYAYRHDVRGQDVTKEQVLNTSYDPENGLFTFDLAYFVSAGYFGYGNEYLQLPGFDKADYSLTLTDGGAYKNGKTLGEVVSIELGADLASVKYSLFGGELTAEEASEMADGIFSGEIESTTTTESGYKVITVDEEGAYTLVAVGFDSEGKRQTDQTLTFTYASPTSEPTWTALYQGDYKYTQYFGTEDEPATDEGLTLYQQDDDPTKFKIEKWGMGVDFTFTMDSDGKIVVDDQPVGYTDTKYGEVMVGELKNYSEETSDEDQSYYDSSTGTFYFNVVYYVSAGYFGAGTETFTLTGNAASAAKKALAAAKSKGKGQKAAAHKLHSRKTAAKNGSKQAVTIKKNLTIR